MAALFTVTAMFWLAAQYRSDQWVPLSGAAKSFVAFGIAVLVAVVTSSELLASVRGSIEIIAGILMLLVLEQLLVGRRIG